MAFQGFTGDFVGFFLGLETQNSKEWFDAHRKQYERDVRGPVLELLAELEPHLGAGKMFRLNRDIRFSADKSPYKTNVGAVAGPLYIHLDARRFYLGTGAHMPDSAWLGRYREAVAGPAGKELARIIESGRSAGLNVGGNPLKTSPRGYPPDHERIELLRWREVVAGRGWEIEPWIASPSLTDRILETWAAMRPFADWLTANVPETEPSARRR